MWSLTVQRAALCVLQRFSFFAPDQSKLPASVWKSLNSKKASGREAFESYNVVPFSTISAISITHRIPLYLRVAVLDTRLLLSYLIYSPFRPFVILYCNSSQS